MYLMDSSFLVNMRFMRILAGVLWKEGVKQQTVGSRVNARAVAYMLAQLKFTRSKGPRQSALRPLWLAVQSL